MKTRICRHHLEEPKGQLTEAAGPRGGCGDLGPAAKPGVTDTLISLVFPTLRCNQARGNFEPSICYTGRQREEGRGQGDGAGAGGRWAWRWTGQVPCWEAEPGKDGGAQSREQAGHIPSVTQPARDRALTRARSRHVSFQPPPTPPLPRTSEYHGIMDRVQN